MKKLCVALIAVITLLLCCTALADEAQVGGSIFFGQYEQDGKPENGTEPIEWSILDIQDGRALVVSRYALDCLPFHNERIDVVWADSSIRTWLNDGFYAHFSEAEQQAIMMADNKNNAIEGNAEWMPADNADTHDKVFLLSYAQALRFFPEQNQRKLIGTEYARSQGARFLGITALGIGETDWWLRSPGKVSYDACFIDVNGIVGTKCVSDKLGIRPALWLDLTADRSGFAYEQYSRAIYSIENGEYSEAAAILETLGSYCNSMMLATECRYQQAIMEAASGNYDVAIELFVALDGYLDSYEQCRACRYAKAVAYQDAGDYETASALFGEVGQYRDSMSRMKACFEKQGISVYYFSDDAVNAGVDTGYSRRDIITGEDKHFGWRLGRFFLNGFTRVTEGSDKQPVFIKTLGDSITLWFDLEQDINSLNSNQQMTICQDANGYDQQFGVQRTDFGRGTLIVRHTNYQNSQGDPSIYTDYLLAKGTTGANTKVILHEEGDYEVALDYEVQDNDIAHIASKFGNYRITLRFSIRNGNCMVYPFDALTGAELQNTAVTANGFKLDLARSRYLDIDVKRSVIVETEAGMVEDERFNRPAKDGDQYIDEGIYTISVSNRYTGESTTKTLFVGSEELLQQYVEYGFSIDRLK